MAPLQTPCFFSLSKVHIFLPFLFLCASMLVLSSAYSYTATSIELFGRRGLLDQNHVSDDEIHHLVKIKKKSSTTPNALGTTPSSTQNKNKTKPTTSSGSASGNSSKSQTKHYKDSPFQEKSRVKVNLKKSNSTLKPSNSTSKPSYSTKPTSKTTNSTKPISKIAHLKTPTSILSQKSTDSIKKSIKTLKKSIEPPSWAYQDDEEDDLVSEFRDLPSKFQETLLPDLEVLSTTSKVYINKANKEITKGFKPIVGKKYAPIVASIISFAFVLIPFIIVSLIFNRIKAYFSLQRLVIFIQIYLSIYFIILCISSLVTGLEPLKFFYATSQSTYICIQLLQTLAYVLYLMVLLMYFVLVFSTETGMGSKLLGLGQLFIGFAVGLHYYMTVFHRAVLHQPPKSSWRVHAIYATCFVLICLLSRLERRKKAYVVDGSEQGKKS